MRYLCLIYTDEAAQAQATPEQWQQLMDDYNRYGKELEAAGVDNSGQALQPTSTATTVRVRDGEVLTTDGPFAETKDHLGGLYVLKADDLDGALAWASKVSALIQTSIEVRPFVAEMTS
jgi:hypothetical protein